MTFKRADRIASISPTQAKAAEESYQDISPEMREKHEKMMQNAEKKKEKLDLQQELVARYKIEVLFGPGRTLQGPNICKVQFWESGRRMSGEGDDLMFICRDSENPNIGCGNIFSSDHVRGIVAICPKCQKAINAEKLTRGFKRDSKHPITTKELANDLAKWWHQLGSNADIYLKFDPSDERYKLVEKQFGTKRAREVRGRAIYPLKNILADTAHGATLEGRILAFLTA